MNQAIPFRLGDLAQQRGYRLFVFDELGSTNDEAMRAARGGDAGRTWFVARSQSRGRGRQGRQWVSPSGNLYASLLLIDAVAPQIAPRLGFVAGVALACALRECIGDDKKLRLKWPNDILYDGAKLAGILLESTTLPGGGFACIMGIGVNCASRPSDLAYRAIALADIAAPLRTPQDVFKSLSDALIDRLDIFAGGTSFATIREEWLATAAGLDETIRVNLARESLTGIFRGIDDEGRLILEAGGTKRCIEAGDVWLGGSTSESGSEGEADARD